MEAIYIHGGIALQGQVRIQGSKNAVLPILAATLLTEGTSLIENCPRLTDVYYMQSLLECLGCRVTREGDKLKVNAEGVDLLHALSGLPEDAVKGMRSSVVLLGALLGRVGEVRMKYPGGCVIGGRPIDLHIEAIKQLGVTVVEDEAGLFARTDGLKGAEISLPVPSVGATENVILAAVKAKGETLIRGAAREPEIETLCAYLNRCGADIAGAGSSTIVIQGVEQLRGTEFTIPGDRIVAGTYLGTCMAVGGEVLLKEAPVAQMEAVLALAGQMGVALQDTPEGLYVQVHHRPKAPEKLVTDPYPGFPTDLQSVFLTALSVAEGSCLVEERIFENRFHTVPWLQKMGARVTVEDERHVLVEGVEELHGYTVEARELRGGAALVAAGAAAKGATIVDGCSYIERGYENICRDFRELGVRIYGV